MEGVKALGPDKLVLLPPPDDVLLGVWRAEAIVAGDRIRKVVFSVDGEAQLSRTRPPYSAEVRLPLHPHETVIRVEGFDDQGGLLASDQVVVNRTQGGFRVLITDPPLGRRMQGRIKARAEVTVPEERTVESVEFRVNDRSIGVLHSPPWLQEIEVPEREPLAYLTVVARLDDGTTAEGVRVLRAPANFSEVNVDLVEVFASVLGSDGHPVRGLQASDFEVFEGGKRKPVARFEEVGNLPLSIGIALDSSFSMASSIGEAKRAAADFLGHLVTPSDRSFALTFGGRPDILVPPVDDVGLVSEALEKVKSFGRTALYDGIVSALYLFRAQPGQRALVVITDGEDTTSGTSWEDALAFAQRSGVSVYTVGIGLSELKRGARNELSDLAAATGGRAFFVSRADELAKVYSQVQEELRSRYLLVYSSDLAPEATELRQVEVRCKQGRVRASRGAAR
jgi:VWFA-related protein